MWCINSARPGIAGLLLLLATACVQDPPARAATAPGCLGGDGRLQATLRGALTADIDWEDAQMQCDGDLRPDGDGLRITVAGPLPAGASADAIPRTLRFIFGIGLQDQDPGNALVLPTNLTVIVEGAQQIYSTRGDGRCAVETLQRSPLQGASGQERIVARGYCTDPAAGMTEDSRLLVPTFAFSALLHTEETP